MEPSLRLFTIHKILFREDSVKNCLRNVLVEIEGRHYVEYHFTWTRGLLYMNIETCSAVVNLFPGITCVWDHNPSFLHITHQLFVEISRRIASVCSTVEKYLNYKVNINININILP